ncbi:MAG: tetratricopeptide repeat protein [Gemmatimonadota bacterium]
MRPRILPRSLLIAVAMALGATVGPAWAQGSQGSQGPQARRSAAEEALRTGDYEKAVDEYARHVRRAPNSAVAVRGLVAALKAIGEYRQAEKAALRFNADVPSSPELLNPLGEILHLQGKRDEAAAAFARAIALDASDSLTARVNLAELNYERGRRAEAMAEFDRFIDIHNAGSSFSAAELVAIGRALRYLGIDDPRLYKDALRVFDEAIAADPTDPEPRMRVGELFLEKYNSAGAQEAFAEVLQLSPNHPGATLGMAQRAHFDGSSEAFELTRKSLEVNPNLVAARVFLAKLYMEAEEYDEAAEEAERALSVNPASLEALAALAATRFLQGDRPGFEEARSRVLSLNPRYAGLHVTLAEASARNRLYKEAAEFARGAVELDPTSWSGYALLGVNQLRLGAIEEGTQNLEVAFTGDPYDIWTKNTLDLLDTFVEYAETRSPRFLFFIDGVESELLTLYFSDLAEEAYERMSRDYRYEPATPIRVEVLRTHADFSVRTIGLAGLGALGVSFGTVIAMDSPGAREIGHFNWGSTFWHELAHTFHLGMTDHRVPRWFSEGLAVYEERRARPGWGGDATPGFLVAYLQERLLPLSELNNGFVRPTYPQQIIHSYYQASLVCEFIADGSGFQALVDMLDAYRNGLGTSQAVELVLDMSVDELNDAFFEYFEQRFATPLVALAPSADPREQAAPTPEAIERRARANSGDFAAQLSYGQTLFREGRHEEAEIFLTQAKELFPEYAGPGSPYWYLALVFKERGSYEAAAAELEALIAINGRDYGAHLELAALRQEIDDPAGAAAALDRALYISPGGMQVHERLAELAGGVGDHEMAIRERRAIVALDPTDRAEALYQLAAAYYAAGELGDARREVVRALEYAPNFEKAQELLLTLHAQRSGDR